MASAPPSPAKEAAIPFLTWQSARTIESHPKIAVLAIHGRGQSPAFMQEEALRFDVPGLTFYAPHAPNDTWYPLGFMMPLEENEPKLSESLKTVASIIETILADGFTYDQIVLWGFSQGACLITQFVLGNPETYGGILIFTGGYLGPEALPVETEPSLLGVPIVIRSVHQDPWVPESRVAETAEVFAAMRAIVNVRIDQGDVHGITDEAIATGADLLTTLVARSQAS